MISPDYADVFVSIWAMLAPTNAPSLEREYKFHPDRKWRFDACWRNYRVAVEINGGNWMARNGRAVGRHTRQADYDKRNAAAVLGWRVLQFTPQALRDDPQGVVDTVLAALGYDNVH
jgi:very-short-patch-repair endonuclease